MDLGKLDITYIPIDEIKRDSDNPNRMTEKQLERLESSIKKYGTIVPIIVDKNNLLADGEQRLQIYERLGIKKVPAVKLDIEDVDRRLLRQVLNKLRGEHELIADALEFERIIEMGREDELKHLLDLSDSQLERYLAEIREPKPEDFEIPEIDKIKTDIKRGDIIKLGSHRLMCGDATSKDDVTLLMDGYKADMVFTDPPYNVGLEYAKYDDNKTSKEYLCSMDKAIGNLHDNLSHGACIYIMTGEKYRYFIEGIFRKYFHYHQQLIWMKDGGTASHMDYNPNYELLLYGWLEGQAHTVNKHNQLAAEVFNRPLGGERTPHPAQRPIPLISKYILTSSHNPQIITDVFGGSGSTLIACEQTGRHCYMMEIDPRYCQVIVDRWMSYTNQKAEKLD